jgi:hypothetical protein
MKYVVTPIAVSVHSPAESPIFGEGCTHIRVEDEGGDAFLVIARDGERDEGKGEFRFDLEELEAVTQAARALIQAQPGKAKP